MTDAAALVAQHRRFVRLDLEGQIAADGYGEGNCNGKERLGARKWLQLPPKRQCRALVVIIPAFAHFRRGAVLKTDCHPHGHNHAHRYKGLPSSRSSESESSGADSSTSFSQEAAELDGSSPHRRHISSYSIENNSEYLEIPYHSQSFHITQIDTDEFIEIVIHQPGSYRFFIEYSCSAHSSFSRSQTQEIVFVVEPEISIRGCTLSSRELAIETLVPDYMGTVDKWWPFLQYVSEKGFNAIHLLPVMARGAASRSPYCSAYLDQIDPLLFAEPLENDVRINRLAKLVKKVESELGMLTIGDINLSHVAIDTPWITEHTEAVVSVENTPSLEAAFVLDLALYETFNDSSIIELLECNSNPRNDKLAKPKPPKNFDAGFDKAVRDLADLRIDAVNIDQTLDNVLRKTKLWEFYKIDKHNWAPIILEQAKKLQVKRQLLGPASNEKPLAERIMKLLEKSVESEFAGRFGRKINVALFASIADEIYAENQASLTLKDAVDDILNRSDLLMLKQYEADMSQMKKNVSACVKDRIAKNQQPLLDEYFFIKVIDSQEADPVYNSNCEKARTLRLLKDLFDPTGLVTADSLVTPTNLLQRNVQPFTDCVRLNFNGKDDKFLKELVTRYVGINAEIFQCLRIDFSHGTSLDVLKFSLKCARAVRPNVVVIAEYLGPGCEIERYYKELGLVAIFGAFAYFCESQQQLPGLFNANANAFIGCLDVKTLASKYKDPASTFSMSESLSYGRLDNEDFFPALFGQVEMVISDSCHDIHDPFKYRECADLLASAALAALSVGPNGSVLGFDEGVHNFPELICYRHYMYPSELHNGPPTYFRQYFNGLRKEISQGMSFSHLQHDGPFILLHRFNDHHGRGLCLIARTAFKSGGSNPDESLYDTNQKGHDFTVTIPQFHARLLNVLSLSVTETTKEPLVPSRIISANLLEPTVSNNADGFHITIRNNSFPAGSICVLDTSLLDSWAGTRNQYNGVDVESNRRSLTASRGANMRVVESSDASLPGNDLEMDDLKSNFYDDYIEQMKSQIVDLSLDQIRLLLYMTHYEEDLVSGGNSGTYHIEGFGNLRFAGFKGWIEPVYEAKRVRGADHPLIANLQQGHSAPAFLRQRLALISKMNPMLILNSPTSLDSLASPPPFINTIFMTLYRLETAPLTVLPQKFCELVLSITSLLEEEALRRMSAFVQTGNSLIRRSALISVAFYGRLNEPDAIWRRFNLLECWRGLLLLTGRFDDALAVLLAVPEELDGLKSKTLLSPQLAETIALWIRSVFEFAAVAPKEYQIWTKHVSSKFMSKLAKSKGIVEGKWNGNMTRVDELVYILVRRLASELRNNKKTNCLVAAHLINAMQQRTCIQQHLQEIQKQADQPQTKPDLQICAALSSDSDEFANEIIAECEKSMKRAAEDPSVDFEDMIESLAVAPRVIERERILKLIKLHEQNLYQSRMNFDQKVNPIKLVFDEAALCRVLVCLGFSSPRSSMDSAAITDTITARVAAINNALHLEWDRSQKVCIYSASCTDNVYIV